MYIQDITKSDLIRIDRSVIQDLAKRIISVNAKDKPSGKSTAGSTLKDYYSWWREHIFKEVVIRLDPLRTFDATQKTAIRARDEGKYAICKQEVSEEEADYDHFTIPYRDGGKTEVENGRLVHRSCHRGRPSDV